MSRPKTASGKKPGKSKSQLHAKTVKKSTAQDEAVQQARETGRAAIREVLQGDDFTATTDYLPDLMPDVQQIRLLAEGVDEAQGKLKVATGAPAEALAGAIQALRERVRQTREFERTAGDLRTSVTGFGLDPDEAPFARLFTAYRTGIGAKDRNIRPVLEELQKNVDLVRSISGKLVTVADKARLPELIAAAGGVDPLKVVDDGLGLQPHVPALLASLQEADDPGKVPALLTGARAAVALLVDVFNVCHKNADGKADTAQAGRILAIVTTPKKRIDYFLRGEGGQRLTDLAYAASAGAPVWSGDIVAGATIGRGRPGDPAPPTIDQIIAAAQPLDVGGGAVGGDNYVGNTLFGNNGAAQGMILPSVRPDGVTAITYREYDLRPLTAADRGPERVVVGSDNRRYYTADHYKTLRRIV